MDRNLVKGLWPVMITPFQKDRTIDYGALKQLIAWYEEKGANGLFAACQSSEIFFLSLKEREQLVSFVKRHAHVPVIASGHVSNSIQDQLDELKRMQYAGADALILITNRLQATEEHTADFTDHLNRLLSGLDPAVPLGFYECPYPFKRMVTNDELAYCAGTGRFLFMKDTCCDSSVLVKRLKVLGGTQLKLFNANTCTLLSSLRMGAAGFSGVMANFHPELYAWLLANWQTQPEKAEQVQAVLTVCSFIERQLYPTNAKYHLSTYEGIPMTTYTRSLYVDTLPALYREEVAQMQRLAEDTLATLKA